MSKKAPPLLPHDDPNMAPVWMPGFGPCICHDCEQKRHQKRHIGALLDEAARARAVWLKRHARLSEAVELDPGYSADATVNKAIADLASLRARLAESETKAAAMRDAIREHDYIRRECPNRAERIASRNAVAASAGLTPPEPT